MFLAGLEQAFRGWWRHADHMMRTVVSAFPLRLPIHSIVFASESPGVAVFPPIVNGEKKLVAEVPEQWSHPIKQFAYVSWRASLVGHFFARQLP
jgi:hypothetical protein